MRRMLTILMLSVGLLFSCAPEKAMNLTPNTIQVQPRPETPTLDKENCEVLSRYDYDNFFIVFTRGCFGKGKMCQHLRYVQVQFEPKYADAAALKVAQHMYIKYGDSTKLKAVYDYREYDGDEKIRFIRIVYRIKTKIENTI